MNMAASSSTLRQWWDNYHCDPKNLEHIDFFGRGIGGVAAPAVDAFLALEMVLDHHGYEPSSRWAYNCRDTAAGLPSLHGYGIAIDIDPSLNPATSRSFKWADTAFTSEQIEAVEAIETTMGAQLWAWGGRWNSFRDYMHFQVDRPPGHVAVNWTTVDGWVRPGPRPPAPWAAEAWQKAIDKELIGQNADPHLLRKGQWFVNLLDKLGELD